jgi:hypothetical protein
MEAESSFDQAEQISVEEPQQQVQEKKKRGRKPAAEAKPKAPATGRKRGPASQKTSSTDTVKVRKMRASPVKRKRCGDDGSTSDTEEFEDVAVVAPRERPKRGNAKKAVYVESDSDKENDPN